MQNKIAFLIFIVSLLFSNIIKANQKAYETVNEAAKTAFARFLEDQDKILEDKKYATKIIKEELMPYVDYKYASFMVIGKSIKKTTKEERNEFSDVFRDNLIATYTQLLGKYTDQTIEFKKPPNDTKNKIVQIKGVIKSNNKPNVDIIFKMRLGKDGNWRAFDMVAEGVSMLNTKQSELSGLIAKDGISSVIKTLKEQNKSLEQQKNITS